MAVKRRKRKTAKKRSSGKKRAKKAVKKAAKKAVEEDFLVNVHDDKRFWLCDGGVLSNLVELRDALKFMNDGVFTYHVNTERNDFSNWIRDVIGDRELASSIVGMKEKQAIGKKV